MEPRRLSQSEVVLFAPDLAQGLALAYAPGETPTVVANAAGSQLADLLWTAQELGVPIVECAELHGGQLNGLAPGQEIGPALFRPAALAIALVQRSRPGPTPVRLVKDLGRAPSPGWKRKVARVKEQLDVSRVWLEVRQPDWLGPVQNLTLLHRERLQQEIGLPLLSLEARHNPELSESGAIFVQGSREYTWQVTESPDFGDLMRGLHEVVARNAYRLLGFRETETLVAAVRKAHPGLYKALFPDYLTVSGLRQILRNLLREGIKIKDLTAVLEAVEEHKLRSQDPDQLTEFVRASLNFQLCREYADAQGVLHAMLILPELESSVLKDIKQTSAALWFDLDVEVSLKLLGGVAKGIEKAESRGFRPVMLCSPRPRRFLKRLVEPSFPRLPVLSYAEVAADADVQVFTTLGLGGATSR